MSLSGSEVVPSAIHVEVSRARSRKSRWMTTTAVVLASIGAAIWFTGITPAKLWSDARSTREILLIDRGDIPFFVVECGALESAKSTTIKCEVEALLGITGGATQPGAGTAKTAQGAVAPPATTGQVTAPASTNS